jgi:hypothetical protein
MFMLDYYNNDEIRTYTNQELKYIKNREDREDCQQEIWAEIYDFMPLDVPDTKRLIKRVCEKFKRGVHYIDENETILDEVDAV